MGVPGLKCDLDLRVSIGASDGSSARLSAETRPNVTFTGD